MKKYKITWFCNKTQKITDKFFKGKDAYEKAIKWGKKTLTNFNYDLISMVK